MGARGRALVSLYLDNIKTVLYICRIVSACFSQCTAVPASEALAACQALARGNMKVAGTWLWVGGRARGQTEAENFRHLVILQFGNNNNNISELQLLKSTMSAPVFRA